MMINDKNKNRKTNLKKMIFFKQTNSYSLAKTSRNRHVSATRRVANMIDRAAAEPEMEMASL
jgi:hypothetical protein